MDRRERAPDAEETLRIAFAGMQSRIWTALPGIVQKVGKMKVDVQPAINGVARAKDGTTSSKQMPVLLDCPVLWQGGGGVTLTFPIAAGDECLVILASRCIDAWYAKGGVQDAPELRMHNLSDGFALVGVRSAPRAFTPSATAARLTNDDGSAYYELNPTAKTFKIVAPGGVTINNVTIDSNGNVSSPATITASTDVVGSGKSLKSHVHSGVQAGGSNTGAPV
jgi:hypothetical protein